MDDPLRITTDRGMLFARLEAQQARTTAGVPLTVGKWYHIAAVKSGTNLTLFLDSQHKTTAVVPATLATAARSCALGGNPNYSGNEFLAADFAGFSMALRAFTTEEVQVLAQPATK